MHLAIREKEEVQFAALYVGAKFLMDICKELWDL